jgi:hypothetical protein
LDHTIDAEDIQLIRDIYAGGESRRMGLNSIAVRIEDIQAQHIPDTFQSIQSGNHAVTVRIFQSFQAGELLSREGMDAVLQLFINRDLQMCEAYAQVNEKKPGYTSRSETFYVKSNLSVILMRDQSVESLLQDPTIRLCIQKRYFWTAYRCIIPVLWDQANEWILITMDPTMHLVNIIYPKYTPDVLRDSSRDERVSNSIRLKDKIDAILLASSTVGGQYPPQPNNQLQQQLPEESHSTWQYNYFYNISGSENTLSDSINNRSPEGMDCGISSNLDSGLYILHAMECDYYDCPIFNTTQDDWNAIRMKISHCVLNKQLIL